MPYIEDGTLRDRIAQGPLTEIEAGKILEQIASALQFAHDHGILHRDIKPSNILLQDNGHVYLADFGLAKEIEETSDITQTGCLIGTPEYMAPELAEQPASPGSDIYALGVLLYQMLTGQIPFKGNTPLAIYWKHIQEQPTPPSVLNPAISYNVELVILKALEKDPARRFTTVQELAQAYAHALGAAQQTSPRVLKNVVLALPVQRVIPLSRARERLVHPAVAVLAVAFLFITPLALGFSVYNNRVAVQVPLVLGASAQFATVHRQPPEFPLVPKPTLQPVDKQQVNFSYGQSSQSDGSRNDHSGHHGHRHRHRHGHHGH